MLGTPDPVIFGRGYRATTGSNEFCLQSQQAILSIYSIQSACTIDIRSFCDLEF